MNINESLLKYITKFEHKDCVFDSHCLLNTLYCGNQFDILKKYAELSLCKGSEKVDKTVNVIFLLEFLATST